ncbi:MAG: hypothetical protein ACRC0G_07550 [Fusobacteriaceae bacterium]
MNGGFDVVFKIALDSRGLKDNMLEFDLFFDAPATVIENGYLIEVFEKSENDLILVSREADLVMDIYTSKKFKNQIHRMFSLMDKYYLLDDMDPANLAVVYAEHYDGSRIERVTIIDSANLVKKGKLDMFCTSEDCVENRSADTYLEYTQDMKRMFCRRCGTHYTFADIKGTEQMTDADAAILFTGKSAFSQRTSDRTLDMINSILSAPDDDDHRAISSKKIDAYEELINTALEEKQRDLKERDREREIVARRNRIVENTFYTDTSITASQLQEFMYRDEMEEEEDDEYDLSGFDDEVFDVNSYDEIGY